MVNGFENKLVVVLWIHTSRGASGDTGFVRTLLTTIHKITMISGAPGTKTVGCRKNVFKLALWNIYNCNIVKTFIFNLLL